MAKSFTNWSQIEVYLQEKLNDCLQKEVAEMVKDKISDHVKSDVYDVYRKPIEYKRRGFIEGSGGLGDTEQMDSRLIQDGVLEVKNNADFNHPFAYTHGGYGDIDLDKSLTENIEFGYGLMDAPFNQPRPFIKNTREEIRSSRLHIEILKSALKSRG
jgi:hypothetical protein